MASTNALTQTHNFGTSNIVHLERKIHNFFLEVQLGVQDMADDEMASTNALTQTHNFGTSNIVHLERKIHNFFLEVQLGEQDMADDEMASLLPSVAGGAYISATVVGPPTISHCTWNGVVSSS